MKDLVLKFAIVAGFTAVIAVLAAISVASGFAAWEYSYVEHVPSWVFAAFSAAIGGLLGAQLTRGKSSSWRIVAPVFGALCLGAVSVFCTYIGLRGILVHSPLAAALVVGASVALGACVSLSGRR